MNIKYHKVFVQYAMFLWQCFGIKQLKILAFWIWMLQSLRLCWKFCGVPCQEFAEHEEGG